MSLDQVRRYKKCLAQSELQQREAVERGRRKLEELERRQSPRKMKESEARKLDEALALIMAAPAPVTFDDAWRARVMDSMPVGMPEHYYYGLLHDVEETINRWLQFESEIGPWREQLAQLAEIVKSFRGAAEGVCKTLWARPENRTQIKIGRSRPVGDLNSIATMTVEALKSWDSRWPRRPGRHSESAPYLVARLQEDYRRRAGRRHGFKQFLSAVLSDSRLPNDVKMDTLKKRKQRRT